MNTVSLVGRHGDVQLCVCLFVFNLHVQYLSVCMCVCLCLDVLNAAATKLPPSIHIQTRVYISLFQCVHPSYFQSNTCKANAPDSLHAARVLVTVALFQSRLWSVFLQERELLGIDGTTSLAAQKTNKKHVKNTIKIQLQLRVATYSRINSTAASYLRPSSIRASATSTGALPKPATQCTATQASGFSWYLCARKWKTPKFQNVPICPIFVPATPPTQPLTFA